MRIPQSEQKCEHRQNRRTLSSLRLGVVLLSSTAPVPARSSATPKLATIRVMECHASIPVEPYTAGRYGKNSMLILQGSLQYSAQSEAKPFKVIFTPSTDTSETSVTLVGTERSEVVLGLRKCLESDLNVALPRGASESVIHLWMELKRELDSGPFSISVGALHIASVCVQCTIQIIKWVADVRTVEARIQDFYDELRALQGTYEDLEESLRSPVILKAARSLNKTSDGSHLWSQIRIAMDDSTRVVSRVKEVLTELSIHTSLLRPAKKQLYESLTHGKLLRLRQRIQFFNANMSYVIQMICVRLQLEQRDMLVDQQRELEAKFFSLEKTIQDLSKRQKHWQLSQPSRSSNLLSRSTLKLERNKESGRAGGVVGEVTTDAEDESELDSLIDEDEDEDSAILHQDEASDDEFSDDRASGIIHQDQASDDEASDDGEPEWANNTTTIID